MNKEKNKNLYLLLIVSVLCITTVLCIYIIFNNKKSNNDNNALQNTSNKQNNQTNINEKITLNDLYGTYKYDYEYINNYGNKVHLKLELTLNSDGTATYYESDGYVADKTRGTYTYENNKIQYTKKNHITNSGDTTYDDGNPIETFTVVDKNTLQNIYNNQTTNLKK